jgi:hypothetical protein
MAEIGKARARNQSDIAGPDHCDTHYALLPVRGDEIFCCVCEHSACAVEASTCQLRGEGNRRRNDFRSNFSSNLAALRKNYDGATNGFGFCSNGSRAIRVHAPKRFDLNLPRIGDGAGDCCDRPGLNADA